MTKLCADNASFIPKVQSIPLGFSPKITVFTVYSPYNLALAKDLFIDLINILHLKGWMTQVY